MSASPTLPSPTTVGLLPVGDGFQVRDPAFADPSDPADRPERPFQDAWAAQPLIARFDELAALHPDRVVAEDGVQTLTFGALARCVDGFGARLAAHPADRAGPVAVMLADGMAFLPIVLTLFASGRVFTVIDAAHPPERQRAILDEVRPALVLSAGAEPLGPERVDPGAPQLVLDIRDPGPGPRPETPVNIDAPGGLIFTSGSTGRAKGVVASQRAYLEYLQEYVNALRIGPDDCLLSVATLSAAGARECLAAALTGAKVRILDFKAAGLAGAFQALRQATILTFVPSVMRAIAGVPGVGEACANLRVLDFISEPLLTSDLLLFRAVLPPTCRISLEFGATETTSVFRWFVRAEAADAASVPSGWLVPGQAVLLADDQGRPVAPGEVGELTVRSRRVALGLWREGELTPGPFRADPDDPSVRAYATGDLLRLREDGLAEFVGRRDRMIKIRGLQVDLAEVEAALLACPGVLDATAAPVARAGEAARLFGFVVGRGPIDALDLRRRVAAETAEHMAPVRIIQLDELPRLASLKPDLVRLQALALEAS